MTTSKHVRDRGPDAPLIQNILTWVECDSCHREVTADEVVDSQEWRAGVRFIGTVDGGMTSATRHLCPVCFNDKAEIEGVDRWVRVEAHR